MTDTRKALEMAIEALSQDEGWFEPEAAIKACKEALAQPEQEPVAWMAFGENTSWLTFQKESVKDAKEIIPLYTHPAPQLAQKVKVLYEKDGIQTCEILPAPSWQGLTNDRIREIGDNCLEKNNGLFNWIDFARAIEQALRERNCNDTK